MVLNNNNKLQKIIEKIKASVKPAMDSWKDDYIAYIKALEQYCRFDVYKEEPGANAYRIIELKKAAGYTKAIEQYFGRSDYDLHNLVEKAATIKLEKIDIAVTKKLKDVNIEAVELLSFCTTGKDCFCEGSWRINGKNVFSFRTVYAGGWNIQVHHVRTIYSYK